MKRNTNAQCREVMISTSGTGTSVSNVQKQASVLKVFKGNSRLEAVMHIRSHEEARAMLSHRAVPNDPELWVAAPHVKKDALAGFDQSYLPTEEAIAFFLIVLARIRWFLASKNFEDAEYVSWYYELLKFFTGQEKYLPRTRATGAARCMVISGASLTGKTALLQRIRIAMGTPFSLQGGLDVPEIHLVPHISVDYPTCNTVDGLLAALRQALVTEVGRSTANQADFPKFVGAKGQDIAISLCVMLNVCLITIDGAGYSSATKPSINVMDFLLKLQKYSGITVLVSGTCVFMHYLSKFGEKASNFFGGPQLAIDPYSAPELDSKGKVETDGVWYQRNLWYWKLGLFGQSIPMPEELPVWTFRCTQGREGWLVQGFEALHHRLIDEPELLKPRKLTEEIAAEIFEIRLQNQSETIEVVRQAEEFESIQEDVDFYDNVDHLPDYFIKLYESRNRLNGVRGRK